MTDTTQNLLDVDATQNSKDGLLEDRQQEARDHAKRVVEESGTSFGPGMRILSKERREAMYAVYAFCREIDDIADEAGSREEKMAALESWREEIDCIYSGVPQKLTGVALLEPVKRFALPRDEFILLIEGMEMDAQGPIQAPSMEEYLAYCRRVAGAVGMLSMRIFKSGGGFHQDAFAVSLANALQTTNILRDVAEDAEIERLYLPRDLLLKHNIEFTDPHQVVRHPSIKYVCADLGQQALSYFRDARKSLEHFDWRGARPALLMMGVYFRYWQRLRDADWDPAAPIKLSKYEKLRIALTYMVAPPLKGLQ